MMLILPAEADESLVSTAVDRIAKVIAADGGEVAGIDRWGRRRFAYELDHITEGYYVVANFTAQAEIQVELERVLNLADEVIRYKVILLPAKRATNKIRDAEHTEHVKKSTPSPASA